ncbi:hypothetical protein KKB55_03445, partial [Myxococcota bacterium]|nr:hypothetical protein [Myxococcota bacterium]MBU1896807.1 hypothetical protein [Myxococcota bacterium]
SSPDLRKAWLVAYRLFCEMWRAALEKFTLGVATSLPEEGCRPPWLLANEVRVEGIGYRYPPRIEVMELGGSST